MKKIIIATDAWEQTNGVVRTLQTTIHHLKQQGFEILVIHPKMFPYFSFPFYQEIKIAYGLQQNMLKRYVENFQPDHIHISVEGPVGTGMRKFCIDNNINFTSAYHTHFPAYLKKQYAIPEKLTYCYISWFHRHSSKVMVATDYLINELPKHGIRNTVKWTRGVDTELFNPKRRKLDICNHPFALYVGRVSKEKNIEQFLRADTEDLIKVVVGDGPELPNLRRKYPNVKFVGKKTGIELAKYYASAEVFVFPSKTDTFGLVLIESLACGTPVAAMNIPHNYEILNDDVGCLNDDLSYAIRQARKKDRANCYLHVKHNFTWEKATKQFIENLVPT